jgi:hypothetical protein
MMGKAALEVKTPNLRDRYESIRSSSERRKMRKASSLLL